MHAKRAMLDFPAHPMVKGRSGLSFLELARRHGVDDPKSVLLYGSHPGSDLLAAMIYRKEGLHNTWVTDRKVTAVSLRPPETLRDGCDEILHSKAQDLFEFFVDKRNPKPKQTIESIEMDAHDHKIEKGRYDWLHIDIQKWFEEDINTYEMPARDW